ncbi:MAG TPA: Bug family tripartite tricarboxylate transporter substrate binding protein [Ramlibacter sp.]|nr:Bug family tripartite tricarboxylate transporter substrate binding protein [Ramlibacter sp.]
MPHRRELLQATLGVALACTLRPASAQTIEQVKIYFGFPAGSAGDNLARRVGEKLAGTAYTKNPAVVENRPGAGGRIVLEAFRNAPSDGSALTLSPFSCLAIYPHVYTKLSYSPQEFVPVSIAAVAHHGLAVGPLVPATVKTVKDFLGWAKANPGLASYGSPGAGSTPHFVGALLAISNGLDIKHVPYRGSIPGVTDLVGGQIAAMVTPSGDFLANHRAGKIRLLATTGKQRSPFTPEVPTFAEQGFPELVVEEWFGFYAPPKTPSLIVNRANAAIAQSLDNKSVIDSLALVGLIARGSTPQEMAASQQAEFERWGPLVKRVGFTSDS